MSTSYFHQVHLGFVSVFSFLSCQFLELLSNMTLDWLSYRLLTPSVLAPPLFFPTTPFLSPMFFDSSAVTLLLRRLNSWTLQPLGSVDVSYSA
jgi:hypothetical protein